MTCPGSGALAVDGQTVVGSAEAQPADAVVVDLDHHVAVGAAGDQVALDAPFPPSLSCSVTSGRTTSARRGDRRRRPSRRGRTGRAPARCRSRRAAGPGSSARATWVSGPFGKLNVTRPLSGTGPNSRRYFPLVRGRRERHCPAPARHRVNISLPPSSVVISPSIISGNASASPLCQVISVISAPVSSSTERVWRRRRQPRRSSRTACRRVGSASATALLGADRVAVLHQDQHLSGSEVGQVAGQRRRGRPGRQRGPRAGPGVEGHRRVRAGHDRQRVQRLELDRAGTAGADLGVRCRPG